MLSFDARRIGEIQHDKTIAWHVDKPMPEPHDDELVRLMLENHRCNFELWHEEDRARRDDKGSEFVHKAKRAIDSWNQQRNDFVEQMDKYLVEHLDGFNDDAPSNSETPGMIIDRLSILSLKDYHMALQTEREDASEAHREACGQKLFVIRTQRDNLLACLEQLMTEVEAGTRKFLVYYQFKMYNDPAMNPELYKNKS
ncbi:MAG TPA: DUF4254 domain-containing protein [Pseudomonadales bacterium]|nr:DUF4254 domain-containing protein [Pseudomonadales bacterium]